jgi:hypothetical protein
MIKLENVCNNLSDLTNFKISIYVFTYISLPDDAP